MLTVTVLRDELLEGRAIATAGGAPEGVREALERLGARVETLPADGVLAGDEERAGDWARGVAPLDALVYDARQTLGTGRAEAVTEALERRCEAGRRPADAALIPSA